MTPLQKRTANAIVNIFETGAALGRYGAVTLIKDDPGHLTYGRSQTTLASGNLYKLIKVYCDADGARFAAALSPFLPRLRAKDLTLDRSVNLRAALRDAAADPVMRATQDSFFDRNYFVPATTAADDCGVKSALGQTVVYDSFIQGGFAKVKPKVIAAFGAVGPAVTERQWIAKYVELRRAWLISLGPTLAKTTYRMDALEELMRGGKWTLALPLTVRGVAITAELLNS